GISLAVREAGGDRMTETGLSLGTPHYMSPEQATAEREVDTRSDVYSLGAVLYEMLAGHPPHAGSSLQAVLAAVLTKPPTPVEEERPSVSPGLAAVVRRALERLPADRFQAAGELVEALRDPERFVVRGGGKNAAVAGDAVRGRRGERLGWGALTTALALVAVWAWVGPGSAAPDVGPVRFEVEAPTAELGVGAYMPTRVALAPDGRTVYYVAQEPGGVPEIMARPLDALEGMPVLPGRGTTTPVPSPDGRRLIYVRTDGRVEILDLERSTVTEARWGAAGGYPTWDENGMVYTMGEAGVLVRLDPEGGQVDTLLVSSPDEIAAGVPNHALPLPGGRFVLLSDVGEDPGVRDIVALNLETGEQRRILSRAGAPVYLPFGVLAYLTPDRRIEGVSFDPSTATVTGSPRTLVGGVRYDQDTPVSFVVSRNGVLAYEKTWEDRAFLVWVEPDGSERRFDADLPLEPRDVTFSQDGSRLALGAGSDPFGDIWVYDFAQQVTTRITTDSGSDTRPAWTADGRVAFISDRDGSRAVYARSVDGRDSVRLEVRTDRFVQQAVWRDDGAMLFREGYTDGTTNRDIFLRLPGDSVNRPLVATRWDEHSPEISPDGRWLAYVSDESGEPRIHVRPLDREGGTVSVSAESAVSPLWSPDGRTIYYRTMADSLVAAAVSLDPSPRVTGRTPLFSTTPYRLDRVDRAHDIHPDGDRFLFIRNPPAARIVVVTGWFDEVKRIFGIE
ncbi:MAG TPA: protein kinase, partial [Longimicrobiales bacterium]|nr:protein kinase [Longimicrobiales bacterium]